MRFSRGYCAYCGVVVGVYAGGAHHQLPGAVLELTHGYGVCVPEGSNLRGPVVSAAERWWRLDFAEYERGEPEGLPPEGYRFPEPGDTVLDADLYARLYWPLPGGPGGEAEPDYFGIIA